MKDFIDAIFHPAPMHRRRTGRRGLQGVKRTAHVAAFDGSVQKHCLPTVVILIREAVKDLRTKRSCVSNLRSEILRLRLRMTDVLDSPFLSVFPSKMIRTLMDRLSAPIARGACFSFRYLLKRTKSSGP